MKCCHTWWGEWFVSLSSKSKQREAFWDTSVSFRQRNRKIKVRSESLVCQNFKAGADVSCFRRCSSQIAQARLPLRLSGPTWHPLHQVHSALMPTEINKSTFTAELQYRHLPGKGVIRKAHDADDSEALSNVFWGSKPYKKLIRTH